jgi:hypothetical protein
MFNFLRKNWNTARSLMLKRGIAEDGPGLIEAGENYARLIYGTEQKNPRHR